PPPPPPPRPLPHVVHGAPTKPPLIFSAIGEEGEKENEERKKKGEKKKEEEWERETYINLA
ncbi:unnamed protein product, partial [Urochloa humidicola]